MPIDDMSRRELIRAAAAAGILTLKADAPPASGQALRTARSIPEVDLDRLVGQPADIAPSAYLYRTDSRPERNPPEGWILLMQYAGLPFDKPVDRNAAAVRKALCGLLWEEVRPVRRVELAWTADARNRLSPDQVTLYYFDSSDGNAHTWWNPRTVKEAGKPDISADGRTYSYAIPVDTWGVVAAIRGAEDASSFAVPTLRAFVPDAWKKMDFEIEWGFDPARTRLRYDGHIEGYDAAIAGLRPLVGDAGTTLSGPGAWRSARKGNGRRGIQASALYIGSPHWRRVWQYHALREDVARSIVTVWTRSGSFSFQVADLEHGPILAPEYGFFVRANSPLPAVEAMRPGESLPPHPKPEIEPAMQVEVPDERLTAQWKLGAWHILRRSIKDAQGRWHFNDYPFGILASETFMILRALDLQGMHKEAADGLDQWLSLPMDPKIVPGAGGFHGAAKPDRPLGHFSDGHGCLTHASGPDGAGGHMDGVHAMGPGAIMFTLAEHFELTGDMEWLKAHTPRMKANAEWILHQRKLLAGVIPNGERLWSQGLQPAHVVTPDSESMHMQFYESEAYYWLAVKRFASMLSLVDPDEGARMAAEAEAYRKELVAAIDRSIALTPVAPVRDGTYRSFIPCAPYVRGFASGAWGWLRCQGHVGAIYWDTVQSADPLISPAGLLSPHDPRVQGQLDVLEDRLLLENEKVYARTAGYDPEKDWFSHASWQYQCGLERHANIHIAADDAPCFIRSMLNQYAVDIMPGEYTFREHTTGGPPDKIFEESCFLERFRQMLVMEEGKQLWLARATPRAWLEQGKRISVKNAPSHFGPVAYAIESDVNHGEITATVEMPDRGAPAAILLRFRHPTAAPIRSVQVNGKPWRDVDRSRETIRLTGLTGGVTVEARY